MKHTEIKNVSIHSVVMTLAHLRFASYKASPKNPAEPLLSVWSSILRAVWQAVKHDSKLKEMTLKDLNTLESLRDDFEIFVNDWEAYANYCRKWIKTNSGATITQWKSNHPVCFDDLLKEELSQTLYQKLQNLSAENLEDWFQDVAMFTLEEMNSEKRIPKLEKRLQEATEDGFRISAKTLVWQANKKALYKAMRAVTEFTRCIMERTTEDDETECYSLLDVRNFGCGGFANPESVIYRMALETVFQSLKNGSILLALKRKGLNQTEISKRMEISQVAVSKALKRAYDRYMMA